MGEQIVKKKLTDLIKSNGINILRLPSRVFQPYRILILKILYLHGEAEFRELKQDLQITDGNLASHLRALEEDGYIQVHKLIIDRKLRTTYVLTKEGFEVYEQFRKSIAEVIQDDLKR